MTLRRRLTMWYALVLIVCVVLAVFPSYDELIIDAPQYSHAEVVDAWQRFHAVLRDMLLVASPLVIIGLIGGWFFTRRALRPLDRIADMAEKLDEHSLSLRLPVEERDAEIQRLALVFNKMAARLEGSFDRVREFTLHASHELKTPLAILRGEMETRLRSRAELSVEDGRRIVSQIDEIDRLTHIVDSLAFLVKADAQQIQIITEPVPLHELVRDIVTDAEVLATPHQITVRLTRCDSVIVKGDQRRLRQMLVNLTDNAIKHNEAGGCAKFVLQKSEGMARLVILNTGPGLAPEHQEKVFDRFYRGPDRGGNVEGSGLGLSIVRWIVHEHGGTVTFHSESGLTTVTLCLPVCE